MPYLLLPESVVGSECCQPRRPTTLAGRAPTRTGWQRKGGRAGRAAWAAATAATAATAALTPAALTAAPTRCSLCIRGALGLRPTATALTALGTPAAFREVIAVLAQITTLRPRLPHTHLLQAAGLGSHTLTAAALTAALTVATLTPLALLVEALTAALALLAESTSQALAQEVLAAAPLAGWCPILPVTCEREKWY